MPRFVALLLAAAVALVACALVACAPGEEGLWLDDVDEALAVAAETGRPLLFVFR